MGKWDNELMVKPICGFLFFLCLFVLMLIIVSDNASNNFGAIMTITVIMTAMLIIGRGSICRAIKWIKS